MNNMNMLKNKIIILRRPIIVKDGYAEIGMNGTFVNCIFIGIPDRISLGDIITYGKTVLQTIRTNPKKRVMIH